MELCSLVHSGMHYYVVVRSYLLWCSKECGSCRSDCGDHKRRSLRSGYAQHPRCTRL